MPYTVSISASKINEFQEIFSLFSKVRCFGYLKPLLYIVSRSEPFPKPLPRKGMETQIVLRALCCAISLSKTTSPQGDENFKSSTISMNLGLTH
jgi:hypothetical protein